MKDIKTYRWVDKVDESRNFGISRMESIYQKRKGQADDPHRHGYYTVLVVKEAKGKHFIDFTAYPLHDRQVYFISPGQVHQLVEEDLSTGYSLVFSNQFLIRNNIPPQFMEDINLFNDFGHAPPLEIEASQMPQLIQYCEEIYQDFHAEHKFREQAIGALLKLLLIRCNTICGPVFEHIQTQEAGSTILREFKALLEKHYREWHSTAQYARALNITPDYLSRSIKGLTGKTAKEFIQSRITVAAKRLLYFSPLSTKEIGYQLGFSEPGNFSAFFKKCTGQSPSAFKKSPN